MANLLDSIVVPFDGCFFHLEKQLTNQSFAGGIKNEEVIFFCLATSIKLMTRKWLQQKKCGWDWCSCTSHFMSTLTTLSQFHFLIDVIKMNLNPPSFSYHSHVDWKWRWQDGKWIYSAHFVCDFIHIYPNLYHILYPWKPWADRIKNTDLWVRTIFGHTAWV